MFRFVGDKLFDLDSQMGSVSLRDWKIECLGGSFVYVGQVVPQLGWSGSKLAGFCARDL